VNVGGGLMLNVECRVTRRRHHVPLISRCLQIFWKLITILPLSDINIKSMVKLLLHSHKLFFANMYLILTTVLLPITPILVTPAAKLYTPLTNDSTSSTNINEPRRIVGSYLYGQVGPLQTLMTKGGRKEVSTMAMKYTVSPEPLL